MQTQPKISFCPNCHAQKNPYEITCSHCGARSCPNGHAISSNSRICAQCGWEDRSWRPVSKIQASGIAAPRSAPPPSGRVEQFCAVCKIRTVFVSGHCSICGNLSETGQFVQQETQTSSPQFSRPVDTREQYVVRQQSPGTYDAKIEYNCPRCNAKIDPSSGRCPNCGLMGSMQYEIPQQQPFGVAPQASRPATAPRQQSIPPQQFVAAHETEQPSEVVVPPASRPAAAPGQQSTPQQQFAAAHETEQPKCPICFSYISSDSRFCPFCGARCGSGRVSTHPSMKTLSDRAKEVMAASNTAPPRESFSRPISSGSSPAAASMPMPAGALGSPIPAPSPAMPRPFPEERGRVKKKERVKKPAKERGFPEGKRRFPMGLLVAVIVVACALLGMVGFVIYDIQTSSSQPSLTSPSPTSPDSSPPDIESISFSSITETSVTITWKTDEPATSQVQLCEGDLVCLNWTELDDDLVTRHSVTVTDLKKDTEYHAKVKSIDADGNEAVSDQSKTFTTGVQPDITPPIISGVAVSGITQSSATITWTTDEGTTSQVEYGTSTDYGTSTPIITELSQNHTVGLSGLDPDTTYYFRIISKDANENEVTGADQFTTSAGTPIGTNIGEVAPDFTLTDLSDSSITLSGLRGKIVMVNFWATWCGPCKTEMPYFREVYEGWSGDKELVILAVNVAEDKTTVKVFMDSRGYTFTTLLDTTEEVYHEYVVKTPRTVPWTFFIDADGIIQHIEEGGFSSQSELENVLNSL